MKVLGWVEFNNLYIFEDGFLCTFTEDFLSWPLQLVNILSRGRSLPEDLVLKLILARINAPDVQHYGKKHVSDLQHTDRVDRLHKHLHSND